VAKIVLFGQAPFGARVLEGLLARGHDVSAVCVPPDRSGAPLDPLKQAAQEAGVRVVQRASYKGADAAREVDAGTVDLGVLAYVTQIIPVTILDAPKRASICFHPSLLPAYRGGSAINWQLIAGETVGGVTLFRPDDGVDTGPIYLQRRLEIGSDESSGSFYYGQVFEIGIDATLECVERVLAGTVEPVPQDESRASHQPLCRDEHARIDWARPTRDLHNLVRGCDPSPGAHSLWHGETIRVYGSRRAAVEPVAEAGTIVGIADSGIEVAAGDGSLRFAKLAAAGHKKAPASELAAALGLEVGLRLGT